MISKLLALLRNRASSTEETRLVDALRSEAAHLRANDREDEIVVARIVEHAKRRPRIRETPPKKLEWLPSRALLGGATLLAVILLALKFGNEPSSYPKEPKQTQQLNPEAKALFAEPVKTLTVPFAPLAFNPLGPVTDEWNRFAGDTRAKAEAVLAAAKSWTSLSTPPLSIDPNSIIPELPELPELNEFSPYGNELQRLRNDALNAFEALPFVPKRNG